MLGRQKSPRQPTKQVINLLLLGGENALQTEICRHSGEESSIAPNVDAKAPTNFVRR